jgi:hypothetical protein
VPRGGGEVIPNISYRRIIGPRYPEECEMVRMILADTIDPRTRYSDVTEAYGTGGLVDAAYNVPCFLSYFTDISSMICDNTERIVSTI